MCKAMQRNENHFGRVTFPPCERALPPLPPPPSTPHRDHADRGTDPPRRCRDRFTAAPTPTRRTATLWNPSCGSPPTVASGTRRLHRSVGVLKHGRLGRAGEGRLGIRRLDVIDPNRPRDHSLHRPTLVVGRTCVRARVATAYHPSPCHGRRPTVFPTRRLDRRRLFYDDGSRPPVPLRRIVGEYCRPNFGPGAGRWRDT